jgi:hypothetical protein
MRAADHSGRAAVDLLIAKGAGVNQCDPEVQRRYGKRLRKKTPPQSRGARAA